MSSSSSGLGMLDGSINANTNEAFSHPPVSSGVQTVPVPSIDEFNVSEGGVIRAVSFASPVCTKFNEKSDDLVHSHQPVSSDVICYC
jgi:hypothetical protein